MCEDQSSDRKKKSLRNDEISNQTRSSNTLTPMQRESIERADATIRTSNEAQSNKTKNNVDMQTNQEQRRLRKINQENQRIQQKQKEIRQRDGLNTLKSEWFISGKISDRTLNIIYSNKKFDDKILGIFRYKSNEILILSKVYITLLDRGFFRTQFKFGHAKYDKVAEIQRQSNCIFLLGINKLSSKFCFETERAAEKAVEIILQVSHLENVTILPDLELIKRKQKEELAREKRRRKQELARIENHRRRERKQQELQLKEERERRLKQNSCLGCGMSNPKDSNFCLTCGVSL